MGISFGDAPLDAIHWGDDPILKGYYGDSLVWDKTGGFIDEPKIDPAHPLYANTTTMHRLEAGDLQGMSVASGSVAVVDDALASTVAGTVAMVREAFPTPNSRSLRVSATIKVDKTAGRYSYVGWAANNATPTTATPDVYIGHYAGTGIRVGGLAANTLSTALADAQLVDGAWYRVSLAYENGILDLAVTDSNPGRARINAAAEPVDPVSTPIVDPWYPALSLRSDSQGTGAYVPMALIARTNSALGTIRDLYYVDNMLGANSDNAPIVMESKMGDGSNLSDKSLIYSKGKAAPLRVIVTSGGTGAYGGMDFAHGNGRNGHPWNAFRKFWRDLADLGYTVLHTTALHEGWGADDHLAKQLEALNRLKAEYGSDVRLYYLDYSMGGVSMWRALMGRAGFPPIRAAYSIAGISRLDAYYDVALYSAIKTRWPVRANLDEPQDFTTAELVARGTRVRMVTSTGDTNVSKALEHDPMFAKYAGTGLASELVHAGITHFDPTYWNAADCVAFFEGEDL